MTIFPLSCRFDWKYLRREEQRYLSSAAASRNTKYDMRISALCWDNLIDYWNLNNNNRWQGLCLYSQPTIVMFPLGLIRMPPLKTLPKVFKNLFLFVHPSLPLLLPVLYLLSIAILHLHTIFSYLPVITISWSPHIELCFHECPDLRFQI